MTWIILAFFCAAADGGCRGIHTGPFDNVAACEERLAELEDDLAGRNVYLVAGGCVSLSHPKLEMDKKGEDEKGA